jgi:hypothetical protein
MTFSIKTKMLRTFSYNHYYFNKSSGPYDVIGELIFDLGQLGKKEGILYMVN